MLRAFKRLERVLALESQQDYQNKAVVGGIGQFAAFWVDAARDDAQSESDLALVEQIAEILREYGRLPGKEARAQAVKTMLDRMAQQESAGEGAPPKASPAPSAKPAPPKSEDRAPAAREGPRKVEPLSVEPRTTAPAVAPVVEPNPEGLKQPVTVIKGVGPKIAEKLAVVGINTLMDLLYYFPRRYDDYTLMKPISKLVVGEQITIIGTVWQTNSRRTRNNQVMVQSVINDGTGSIQATWFNQPWVAQKLQAGKQIVISGKVDQFLGRPVFNSPAWEPLEFEPLRTRRIVPIYGLTEGLTNQRLRDMARTTIPFWSQRVPDPLPDDIRQRHHLYRLTRALHQIHLPDSQEALHQARRRLIFDELFSLQLGMQGYRRAWRSERARAIQGDTQQLDDFIQSLPFELTQAQQRVVNEIGADVSQDVPMNRLLQGDVGSGKTVVAAAALIMAVTTGTQAALMAPTGILAEQHYSSLQEMLKSAGVEPVLLTGSTPAPAKNDIYEGLAGGQIRIIIGTHALIQEAVRFQDLGLVVIDEQHRFGVEQRGALRQKGAGENGQTVPHLLVMSATPIPRTLALSLYGDLDISVLDEMPPGRQEIKTRWLRSSERERAFRFIRRQVAEGRQAYFIFPLVEESEKIDAKAATEEFRFLQEEVFPDLKLGLVHGRLKADEKEAAMQAFYAAETDILVATSVIEVGVDVPNSTVMVIEGANRFGLAQLHQFRGRVGRGEHQSYCILIADDGTAEAEERLKALEQSNDGFLLAEKDLELRGPGEFFGQRQSGLPELKLASLLDMEMLERAREEAAMLVEADPDLDQPQHLGLREQVAHLWQDSADVS